MKTEERFLAMMINAIGIVASDFETQVRVFPDFVVIPDEVISTFDEAYILFDQVIDAHLVTETQKNAVKAIHNDLEEMDNKRNDENPWTLEAMQTSADWRHLRSLAKEALALFGIADIQPNVAWITYMGGKKPPFQ